jgi:hypothetical protein
VQHFLVRGNMGEQPFVTDVVETSANVALQHPRRTVLAEGVTIFDARYRDRALKP